VRVAVLVSGAGSILDAMIAEDLPIVLVLSDRPCKALGRAEAAGIEALCVTRDRFDDSFDRDAYTAEVVTELHRRDIELVAMAGFGTIFSAAMQDAYGGRILNTHPALLPAFPGWHAVADALAAGVKVTGCTVHVAGLQVDTGPILAQEAVPVLAGDTVDTLHERIKAVERRLYPATIRAVVERGAVG